MNIPDLFTVITPSKARQVPILISVPHAGLFFPRSETTIYDDAIINRPPDTDWDVDKLYPFSEDLGLTLIKANYSRYVVDLNRDYENKNLYADQRIQTDVMPLTTFDGRGIYKDSSFVQKQKTARLDQYYFPYYQKIEQILGEFRDRFGKALLFDAHSIKRHVPQIKKDPFPDLIIGTRDGSSCNKALATIVEETLAQSYQTSSNEPFKGGHITRHFGKPKKQIHAIQLEKSQDIYWDDEKCSLSDKSDKLIETLKELFLKLTYYMMVKN